MKVQHLSGLRIEELRLTLTLHVWERTPTFTLPMRLLLLLLLSTTVLAAEPPIRPEPKLTPGAVLEVTREDLCVAGYTKLVRNVPEAVKRQVYAMYGITSREPGEYEVDHLISLELGGSNSIKNLWPESYRTQPWNAHVKDKVENKLHRMVCSGEIDLKTAQQEIASDWIAAYQKYVGAEPTTVNASASPTTVHPAPSTSPQSSEVWVNTRSGVFWKQGTAYYGKTKEGKYMSEAEALQQGFHASKGH